MRSQLRLRVILPIAALGLLALGAGAFALIGSSQAAEPAPVIHRAGSAGSKEPSLAEWAKRAGAVCTGFNEQAEALGGPITRDEWVAYLTAYLELAKRSSADIEDLGVPRGRAGASVRRAQALDRAEVALLERLAEVVSAGDAVEAVRIRSRVQALGERSNRIAQRLGVEACASDRAGEGDAGLPRKEGEQLNQPVVVLAFYSPDSPVDRLTTGEARAGAEAAGVGFLAVDVTRDRWAAIARRLGIKDAPAVAVVVAFNGVVTMIDGYADRDTVAQAAENALA